MKPFFTRIFRFFWSWGFLKFILFALTFLVLLYVEEDWRGARAWAITKAKWEGRGETFDIRAFTPPLGPENENLAALPIFRITRTGGKFGPDELVDFRRAIFYQTPMPDSVPQIPLLGSWQSDERTDMVKLRQTVTTDYAVLFKGQPPPSDSLAQFDAVYPLVGELREAAATRSSFRLNSDYERMPPAGRSLGPVTDMIALAKIVSAHAVLGLESGRSDLALDDLRVNWIVANGVKRDPDLVGALVSIGIVAISEGAIFHGLVQHEWNDAQLAELERMFGSLHFLRDYQFTMRAEGALVATNIGFFKKFSKGKVLPIDPTATQASLPVPWPGGWWDNNSKLMADFFFAAMDAADPQAELVFPAKADALDEQIRQTWSAPWTIWYLTAAPAMANAARSFSQAQVWADESRLACALERYRLAHNAYPATLEELVPSCIDQLPHDVMDGEPYHYRLKSDGMYLLYSVGWNQKDDDGKVVMKQNNRYQRDYTQGDWVWPTPKR